MPQRTLEPLLRDHKFFAGLDPEYLSLLVGCASNEVWPADTFLFREGEPAQTFYLIREGTVALEIAAPTSGALIVQTLGAISQEKPATSPAPRVCTSRAPEAGAAISSATLPSRMR